MGIPILKACWSQEDRFSLANYVTPGVKDPIPFNVSLKYEGFLMIIRETSSVLKFSMGIPIGKAWWVWEDRSPPANQSSTH